MNEENVSEIFKFICDIPEKDECNCPLDDVKHAIGRLMLINGCTSVDGLKAFMRKVKRIHMPVGIEQILPQYHLVLKCIKLESTFYLNIVRSDFRYFDFDGTMKIGNYFVPQFSLYSYIKQTEQIIRHYPSRFCCKGEKSEHDYLFNSLSKQDIKQIVTLISSLPYPKENIHVGFLVDENQKDSVRISKFLELEDCLESLGYDVYGNPCYNRDSPIEVFDFYAFGWDDSFSETITVLVDFISNDYSIQSHISRFLTFENTFNDVNMPGRLIYISVFHEDSKSQYLLNATRNIHLNTLHNEWLMLKHKPYFLFPLYIYYPKNSNFTTDNDELIQKFIWDFKEGGRGRGFKDSNQSTLEECVQLVNTTLICTFGKQESQELIFLCVPPSTKENYIRRYKRFSERLNEKLGIINGFNMIEYEEDSTPKHLGGKGNPKFNISSGIKGKNIIVFDDVYTTGKTILKFCEQLSMIGGNVLGAIVLGITQHDKNFEKDICDGYQGLYDLYSQNIW